MNKIPFLEKSSDIDRTVRYLLAKIVTVQSYPPHTLIPLDDEYVYVVKKGVIQCSRNTPSKNDLWLLVEGDVFGNPEQLEVVSFRDDLEYSTLENSALFLIPKDKLYALMSDHKDVAAIWQVQIDRQAQAIRTWLKQFRQIKRETLFFELLQARPQFLKSNRVRHLCRALNLDFKR